MTAIDCETKDQEVPHEPAAFLVAWPGKPTRLCLKCTKRAVKVAEAMGFSLAVQLLADEESNLCTKGKL